MCTKLHKNRTIFSPWKIWWKKRLGEIILIIHPSILADSKGSFCQLWTVINRYHGRTDTLVGGWRWCVVQVLREDGNVIGVGEYVCVWVCWNGYLVLEKVGKCRWAYRPIRNSFGEACLCGWCAAVDSVGIYTCREVVGVVSVYWKVFLFSVWLWSRIEWVKRGMSGVIILRISLSTILRGLQSKDYTDKKNINWLLKHWPVRNSCPMSKNHIFLTRINTVFAISCLKVPNISISSNYPPTPIVETYNIYWQKNYCQMNIWRNHRPRETNPV